ncbi:bifunctional tRNA (5-methylaminomethyl-2-thiouridine)(34)-methyltransferase MnmD/FAD-dependent 5-carboxymethylaminomethyl-2-thiouridine(34) oxidoreductase MnmC [Halopseudomonas salina]|uniref:tRNA 5-methylaminomethyl-2-thiouridine biosynthesis bifunctional protein MnmC n=1 Tax=Halopseudomonas salina TaxID=1323744 RepID=A0ABQ1P2X3_9GAMM|nr:bifunctional tRNA (5-methylaminomethyl-2-thiouridine)(34)-methyltransferase MnmD/FAD-dependent 5-carboxymethylaminomethyl-2-thiouridine(34) oxidoreductase MnmC [Halopseudomonas salina]GGC87995.1 tRNA 5-methylaminomethyl-2-thiouridine biosynthesis bifunctional protein MnmC [Halopseudomonas salina]
MTPPPLLADLEWTDDGRPVSLRFGDIYPSSHLDAGEGGRLYLLHNRLESRWRALNPDARFCIAETGFGTGLNFLCAWQLWASTAPADAQLHFISAEQSPFSAADLRRAQALWPELAIWSEQLLEQYSSPTPGWHRYVLNGGKVTLTLLVGDVLDTLKQLEAVVDAWFLSDLAPQTNLSIWQSELCRQLTRLSHPGTTLATGIVADTLRMGLFQAGFTVAELSQAQQGSATLAGETDRLPPREWTPPWYRSPEVDLPPQRKAIVIGAGLAGCSTAYALAQRGWKVTVIERNAGEAREASGNPQGILYCKLSPHQTPLSRFVQSSYGYSVRLLKLLLPQDGSNWSACGVLQLSDNEKESARLRALAGQGYPSNFLHGVTAEQASKIAGVGVSAGGLFFPEGGWVHPPALCRSLLKHPGITLVTHQEALKLSYRETLWHATDEQERDICAAPVVVICSAGDSQRFDQTAHLPLKTIRGQITHLPACPESQALRTVLCGEGYVSPAREGEHFVGASFRFDRSDTEPSEEENISNLALLTSLSAELDQAIRRSPDWNPDNLSARAALRCTSPDYLPLIGPIADAKRFRQDFAVLAKDASKRPDIPAPWLPGLYINTAHGSRGLISCPLSGELIAAMLENGPLPLPLDLVQAVHPSRFMLRQLVRGK